MKYLIINKADKEIPVLIQGELSSRVFDELNVLRDGHVNINVVWGRVHVEVIPSGEYNAEDARMIREMILENAEYY